MLAPFIDVSRKDDGSSEEGPTMEKVVKPLGKPGPAISADVVYAAAHYSPLGLHIRYSVRLEDTTHEMIWFVSHRYSKVRELHKSLSKHKGIRLPHFPSFLFGSSNRSKTEIEKRRAALQKYFQALLGIAAKGGLPDTQLAKLLYFLKHPFADEYDQAAQPGTTQTSSSGTSGTNTAEDGEFSNKGDGRQDVNQIPQYVFTSWLPPRKLPGINLAISLPYVALECDIDYNWRVMIRSDRLTERGLLRHRYDEVCYVSNAIAALTMIPDALSLQELLILFRRSHPLSGYLRVQLSHELRSPYRRESSNLGDATGPTPPRQRRGDPLCSDMCEATAMPATPLTHHRLDDEGFSSERARRSSFSMDSTSEHFLLVEDPPPMVLEDDVREDEERPQRSSDNTTSTNRSLGGASGGSGDSSPRDASSLVRLNTCSCTNQWLCSGSDTAATRIQCCGGRSITLHPPPEEQRTRYQRERLHSPSRRRSS